MIQWLQYCAVTGTVLAAAVLLLRALFKSFFPRRTFTLMFALAVAALLVPFRIPAPTSIYNALPEIPGRMAVPAMGVSQPPAVNLEISETAGAARADGFDFSPFSLVAAISCILTALLLGLYLFSFLRFRDAERIQGVRAFWGAWSTVRVYKSDKVPSPLVVGTVFPKIVLPVSMDFEDTKFVEYIVEHELTHIRRFDNALKFATALAVCLHWYNPIVWLLYRTLCRDIEFSCDEAVLGMFGTEGKKSYIRAMIDAAERFQAAPAGRSREVFVMFGENDVKERVENILRFKRAGASSLALAALMFLGVTAVFATDAVGGASGAPYTESAVQTSLQAEGIARAQAGQGIVTKLEYKTDKHGRSKYDVKILSGSLRHDMTIDAASGNIVKYSQKTSRISEERIGSLKIGRGEAERIAVTASGGGLVCAYELDQKKDGKIVYEIDVLRDDGKHEFEIDAETGTILKFERKASKGPVSSN